MNMYNLIYFYLFSVIYIFTDVDIYLFFFVPFPCAVCNARYLALILLYVRG